jgi:hypothetical protein
MLLFAACQCRGGDQCSTDKENDQGNQMFFRIHAQSPFAVSYPLGHRSNEKVQLAAIFFLEESKAAFRGSADCQD